MHTNNHIAQNNTLKYSLNVTTIDVFMTTSNQPGVEKVVISPPTVITIAVKFVRSGMGKFSSTHTSMLLVGVEKVTFFGKHHV